jgi:energy-coupling factor transport system permease protein
MLKDITLGQYYPGTSIIHRLDPRVKLMGTLVFIVSLFAFSSFNSYLLATVALIAVIFLSEIPVKFIFKGIRAILILMLVTAAFNLFLTPGTVIFRLGFLKITQEGARMTALMAVRLTYLVTGSSIMTLTTTPNSLTDGMETGLGFLKIIHLPVHEIAMMMSIALRFIPILMDETDKIMRAQEARGADFSSGGIIKRAKALVPLLVPLFISAFRRANDLALAMEARGYHGDEGRTKMKPLIYKKRDYIAYIIFVIYIILAFLLSRIKLIPAGL